MKVHEGFGNTRQFYVEGTTKASFAQAAADLPVIEITDRDGNNVLNIVLKAEQGVAVVSSGLNHVECD